MSALDKTVREVLMDAIEEQGTTPLSVVGRLGTRALDDGLQELAKAGKVEIRPGFVPDVRRLP